MIFSSIVFLLYFLPLFLLVYHVVPKQFKNLIILLGSIIFYSWGAPQFIFIIIVSTYIDFHIVRQLYNTSAIKIRKVLLTLSISINLGLLAYFKYSNFFVSNLNSLLSTLGFSEMPWVEVALPIGISFYTFQTLTYSIDVYRKTSEPLNNVLDYMVYIMSFPQMIAGPIVRFNAIANQIVNRVEIADDKLIGFYRFCIGLSKKVLIANVLAEQADIIFDGDLINLSTTAAWIGIFAYTFQIYFDFSGYSDMAIGLGRILGFRFPENFKSPYVSQSISEFWRRWHITLGEFMKDYLYIPLGGNRVSSKYRLFFNLWLVFILSGLWHGSEWNFILWGAYHGLFLILDRIFLLRFLKKIGVVMATLFTFFIVMIGWVIFRLDSISDIQLYLVSLFNFDFQLEPSVIPAFWTITILAVIFSFCTNFKAGKDLETFFFKTHTYHVKHHLILTLLSVILFILCLSSITSSGFNPFIYFRF
ncbi:MAG: sugar acetyltransferase [Flavobacteriales bacterium]|nr:sugar acetyltransferase [Flavobacteriales bacterium]|tara:strand:- start:614 stop:2035 length:1422 start_codon:yes stop_codon:yes gene_type:complete